MYNEFEIIKFKVTIIAVILLGIFFIYNNY